MSAQQRYGTWADRECYNLWSDTQLNDKELFLSPEAINSLRLLIWGYWRTNSTPVKLHGVYATMENPLVVDCWSLAIFASNWWAGGHDACSEGILLAVIARSGSNHWRQVYLRSRSDHDQNTLGHPKGAAPVFGVWYSAFSSKYSPLTHSVEDRRFDISNANPFHGWTILSRRVFLDFKAVFNVFRLTDPARWSEL